MDNQPLFPDRITMTRLLTILIAVCFILWYWLMLCGCSAPSANHKPPVEQMQERSAMLTPKSAVVPKREPRQSVMVGWDQPPFGNVVIKAETNGVGIATVRPTGNYYVFTNLPVGVRIWFTAWTELNGLESASTNISFTRFAGVYRLWSDVACVVAPSLSGPWTPRSSFSQTITNGLSTGNLFLSPGHLEHWGVVIP